MLPPSPAQLIYGCQNLETCGSLESLDAGNKLGVMVTLRMRLECSVLRAGNTVPEQVYQVRAPPWRGGVGRGLAPGCRAAAAR